MKAFRDTCPEPREWRIVVNVETIRRVRGLVTMTAPGPGGQPAEQPVDLLQIAGGALLERLTEDPLLLADVLYAVCKPQADERGVSDVEFGRLLVGDVIDDATVALLEGLVDFFPRAKRAALAKAVAKMRGAEARVAAAVLRKLDDPAFDAAIDREIDKALAMLGPSSGSSPDSSASTPAPGR